MTWICASAIGLVLASALPSAAQGQRGDLDGVWILADSATFEHLELTPAGEAGRAKYDYVMNDPGMKCIPASITRVMHTPSPPIEIRQHTDHVEINYEFMDVHRRVPTNPGVAAKDVPYAVAMHPHLGRSVARYEHFRDSGTGAIEQRYWDLVAGAFAGFGVAERRRYLATTPAPERPNSAL